MALLSRRGATDSRRVLSLRVDELSPNPAQPRRVFDAAALDELAASIREHGILQPLTVRRTEHGYELVAGERRARAAALAGLTEVPCLLLQADPGESARLALIENLQREDLGFREEAEALAALVRSGMTQEEVARTIGKSQSAVANKLRVLKLPADVLELLTERGLTERHARALLPLDDPDKQRTAARAAAEGGLTVAATEALVAKLLAGKPPKRRAPTYIIKDVRLFLNTLTRSLSLVRAAGIPAECERTETDERILLTISLPKRAMKE